MRVKAAQAYGTGNSLDEAVRQYMPLVRRIAFQIGSRMPAGIDIEDMVQEGMTGLLDALRRYKPQPNLSFEVYARTRIRGAIYDAFRRDDILPRHQREKLTEIGQKTRALEHQLGRAPEDAEIAKAVGVSIDEYFAVLDSAVSISGVETLPEALEPEDRGADPANITARAQLARRIEAVLRKLPEKERLVIGLHYQEELSYREIAYVMNLTPGRISQLHTQAMLRLRSALGQADGLSIAELFPDPD